MANKIHECRVLVTSETDLRDNELPEALEDDSYDISVYEFDAPVGWEGMIGLGILFNSDWCNDDIVYLVQFWDGKSWRAIVWGTQKGPRR